MSVTAKIFDGITKTVKGLPDIRTPVFFIERIFEFLLLRETGYMFQTLRNI